MILAIIEVVVAVVVVLVVVVEVVVDVVVVLVVVVGVVVDVVVVLVVAVEVVVDDGGFVEDSVGKGHKGSKHLAAQEPLAKQNILPG